jgi:hypothetical protein
MCRRPRTVGTPLALALIALPFALPLAAPAAGAQGSAHFAAARLAARSDSFAILVQGTPRGYMKEKIEKTADGFRLTSDQSIGGMMSQTTEVVFSPALEMRSVKQTGEARGMAMKIDVSYAGGRATGAATTPGPQGLKTIEVNAEVPAGAVDDNVLMSLVPTLTLTPGATYKVAVFASGQGTLREMTLTVGEKEPVTVLAGSFEAFPVTLTGGPIPVTAYVTVGAAPRMVKLTMSGSPLSFELAPK